MATIRRLPSGKWNVQIRSGGKLIASSTHRSREAAQTWANKREGKLLSAHVSFVDAGYAYCHDVLAGKPSQSLALNRIDRICRKEIMRTGMHKITLQDIYCPSSGFWEPIVA